LPIAIPITLLYGGLTALLVTLLGLNVSRARGTTVGVTTPPPPELIRPIRAHGNAAEWAPLAIVLLLAVELGGRESGLTLHLLGGGLLLARLLHAAGVLLRSKLSIAGASLNYLVLVALALKAIGAHFAR
jgi:hypothetical protein